MVLCCHQFTVVNILWYGMILLYVNCQKPSLIAKRHDIYIAGFFPFTPTDFPETHIGHGVMPAVRLAVEHINDSPTILRNYRLHMWWNDTQCSAAVGVKSFFDFMHEEPLKLMLFGAASTQVTDPIAKASKHWALTQLSYADTDPIFTSANFPNFFRMVPNENAFNLPRIKLLQYFNWTRVGTIYQNEPRFSLAHNNLLAEFDDVNVTVMVSQSLTNNVTMAIERLKEQDVRIILGNFNETWARKIFCGAYRIGLFGRRYQWLIMGTYGKNWWMDTSDTSCTQMELKIALEGCILTDYQPLASSKVITISGFTPTEYQKEYDLRRQNEYSRFHGYTYDGIWAAALAIQNAALRIKSIRKNNTIVDFKYRDTQWETLFIDALKNTSFEGVTGPVRFYDNERKGNILLKQFQNDAEVYVGEYSGLTETLDLQFENRMRWKEGRGPPKDRTLITFKNSHVNFGLYFTLVVFAIIGIITATVFLIINIKYRNQRYIKMSSPYLNNLIIIGCILTYTSVIFLGLDSSLTSIQTFPYICAARAWLLMAGFSLAFGAMFSKTWRVHSIFTDVKLNKKVIKDYQLFMVVGVLLVFDVGIMTTWQTTDPFYRETKNMDAYIDENDEDQQIVPVNEYCQSDQMTWFVGFIYAYKGLLMIFGAFLAWETRHVSIPALNDSKYVGMSVYNVVLMCVLGAAISFVLSDEQNYSFGIISVFILFCSTITVCLVFVPKVVELRRNPQGLIDKRIRATLRPASKTRRESSELEEHFKHAKATNQKYRKILQEKDTELQTLCQRFNKEDKPLIISNVDSTKLPSHQELQQKQSQLLKNENQTATQNQSYGFLATEITELSSASGSDIDVRPDSIDLAQKKTTLPSISTAENSVMNNNNLSIKFEAISTMTLQQQLIDCETLPPKPSTVGTTRRRSSSSPSDFLIHHHQSTSSTSLLQTQLPPLNLPLYQPYSPINTFSTVCPTLTPAKRNAPTFVHQDELWSMQRSCKPTKYLLNDGTTLSNNSEKTTMQRSVSEKNRDKYNHHQHGSGKIVIHTNGPALKRPMPARVQSTPNVLGASKVSPEKLVDLAILPIFQKLLTDREGVKIASCPDIAIKCDIVEYL